MKARLGGGAASWVAGVLAAAGTQGSWQLEKQEIECSRRVCQPVLANMLQYSCLEKPGRPQSAGLQRVGHDQNNPEGIEARFFACGSSAPMRGECEGGAAA